MTLTVRAAAGRSSPRPDGFRLRGRAHKAALTAHVLASVGWFGVAVMVAFCGIAAGGAGRGLSAGWYRVIETAPWLSIPLGLASVATGALLGLGTAWGLVRHWWVVAKTAIAVAVVVTDAALVRAVAHDALATGQAAPALYGSTVAHVVVLAVATVLSVFKPRGRTPWGRRAEPRHRSASGVARRAEV